MKSTKTDVKLYVDGSFKPDRYHVCSVSINIFFHILYPGLFSPCSLVGIVYNRDRNLDHLMDVSTDQ